MLRTRLTERFDLQYPIMSAPMSQHSGGRLAAAVSAAGGLGLFGGIHPGGPEWLHEQIAHVRSQTERPFGIGFINAFIPMLQQNFEAALEERVPVIALSFGEPEPWLSKAKASGATVVAQAQTLADARAAVAAGADILVAQGNAAGGHASGWNLLPFLARLLDEFPDLPVLAAGGVTAGRALAAVLAAGADGAWLGTALLATPEAVEVPDVHKRAVLASDGEDTVFTEVFDIMDGAPWPAGIAGRALRNDFAKEWHGREHELRARREELLPAYREAQQQQDPEMKAFYFGQGATSIDAARPAAELVRGICDEAERLLREHVRSVVP